MYRRNSDIRRYAAAMERESIGLWDQEIIYNVIEMYAYYLLIYMFFKQSMLGRSEPFRHTKADFLSPFIVKWVDFLYVFPFLPGHNTLIFSSTTVQYLIRTCFLLTEGNIAKYWALNSSLSLVKMNKYWALNSSLHTSCYTTYTTFLIDFFFPLVI